MKEKTWVKFLGITKIYFFTAQQFMIQCIKKVGVHVF